MLPLVAILALVAGLVFAADPAPETAIVYQPPSDFRELPATIRRELEKGDFLVPQPFGQQGRNVVRGEFERRGRADWAVLCSRAGISRILVFWAGSPARVDTLAPTDDATFLQSVRAEQMGYSRKIAVIHPLAMEELYKMWGGKPPVMNRPGFSGELVT